MLLLALSVALLGSLYLTPSTSFQRLSIPPPSDFVAAKAALVSRMAAAPSTLSQAGRPRIFLHDGPTDQVFVLLHGLTNLPEQFDLLGQILFEHGYNVVIPLTPGHGEADVMTDKLSSFRAQAMLDEANEVITLSRGLGHHLTVVGLSVNGCTAAWIAQHRTDVDRSVLLSPFFAPYGLPSWGIRPLSHLLLFSPNVFLWWNSLKKGALPGSPYAYPRFSSRSIGEAMALGLDVLKSSSQSPPACPSIVVVTSASDFAGNNTLTSRLVANWRERGAEVTTYEFPRTEHVPHDFIDPHQPDQRIQLVYPLLIELLETGRVPHGK
jgi:carboxylesterase